MKRCAILLLLFLSISHLILAQILGPFEVREYSNPNPILHAEFADLNGDNLEEIIAVTETELVVYYNQGDFEFIREVVFESESSIAGLLQINIDNEGLTEFLLNTSENSLRLFDVNNGVLQSLGSLELEEPNFPFPEAFKLEKGHLNEDDLEDLVIYGSSIQIYLNQGNEDFEFIHDIPFEATYLDVGNLDNSDGDDICFSNSSGLYEVLNSIGSSYTPAILRNDYYFEWGCDDIWDDTCQEIGSELANGSVVLRDIDNDGDDDIFFGKYTYSFYDSYAETYGITPVTSDYNELRLELLVNRYNLNLPFQQNSLLSSDGWNFREDYAYFLDNRLDEKVIYYAIADVGNQIILASVKNAFYLLTGQDSPPIPIHMASLKGQPHIRDLDNNGVPDVIILSNSGTSGILPNVSSAQDADNLLEEFRVLDEENLAFDQIFSLDINGDGIEESVILETSDLRHRLSKILFNELGYPTYTTVIEWQRTCDEIVEIRSADMNNDGFPELFIMSEGNIPSNRQDFNLSIAWNSENGYSSPQTIIEEDEFDTEIKPSFKLVDFNDDGWIDLIVNQYDVAGHVLGDAYIQFYSNSAGTGMELSDEIVNCCPIVKWDIQDVNQDGELDAIFGRFDVRRLDLNSGESELIWDTEAEPHPWNSSYWVHTDLELADFNADGILDIFFRNQYEEGILNLDEDINVSEVIETDGLLGNLLEFTDLNGDNFADFIDENNIYYSSAGEIGPGFQWNDLANEEITSFAVERKLNPEKLVITAKIDDENQNAIWVWHQLTDFSEINISVFDDENGNGLREESEQGIGAMPISFNNTVQDQSGMAFTNSSGNVSFEILAIDSLELEVIFDPEEWVLTTGNSPTTVSAINAPEQVEIGLMSNGPGITDNEESKQELNLSSSITGLGEAKDGSDLVLIETAGITINNYVFIEDDYQYTWAFSNTTGDVVNSIEFESELPNELDWTTFIPQGSSHDGSTVISSTFGVINLLVTYENLNLPDQGTDEEGSVLDYSYLIKAQDDIPGDTEIINQVSAFVDQSTNLGSNDMINRVYTCDLFYESVNIGVLEACSPGTAGFTIALDQPEAEFEFFSDGQEIDVDELELISSNETSSVYGTTLYTSAQSIGLTGTNEFGCALSIDETVQVDTLIELNILSTTDFKVCFDDSIYLYTESIIPVEVEWLRTYPSGFTGSLGILDTLMVCCSPLSSRTYHATIPGIVPACKDTATQEISFNAIGSIWDDGYIQLHPSGDGLQCVCNNDSIYWFFEDELVEVTYDLQLSDPPFEGTYQCQVFYDSCDHFTDPFSWSPTSTNQRKEPEFSIYPSPTADFLNVQFESVSGISEIRIIDNLGKLYDVKLDNPNVSTYSIDVNYLSQGVYHLQVVFEDGVRQSKQFVIAR